MLAALVFAPIWPLTWPFAGFLVLSFTGSFGRFRTDGGGVNRGAAGFQRLRVNVRQHECVSEDRRYLALESAVGALLAAVSAQGGPLTAAAAAAAVPPAHLMASWAFQELGAWRLGAAERMVERASERLALSPDELIDEALSDPQSRAIFADALHASARTFSERKIGALAEALANGLVDDMARVDESHLVIRALGDLEEPHIRLLGRIAHSTKSFTLDDIAGQLPGLSKAAAMTMVATLDRHALLMSDERARQESVSRAIKAAQGKVSATELAARRQAAIGGANFRTNPLETADWFVSRDEPAWVLTDFARLCWSYLVQFDEDSRPAE